MQASNCTREVLNVMVVGQSQVGKTSLVNSLVYPDSSRYPNPTQTTLLRTPILEITKGTFRSGAARLSLNVIDTPAVKSRIDWIPLLAFIEEQYNDHINNKNRRNRNSFVHCCLYIITPSGDDLSPLDVEFMKDLCDKVNVIPVIAKADTLTDTECAFLKNNVIRDIQKHMIRIYGMAEEYNKPAYERMPLAVVSPRTLIEAHKEVSTINDPWSVTNISNRVRNFYELRKFILNTHLQDLKYATESIHYENFLHRKLFGFDIRINVFTQNCREARRTGTRPGEIAVTVILNLHENLCCETDTINLCIQRTYNYIVEENYHEPTVVVLYIVKSNRLIRRVVRP